MDKSTKPYVRRDERRLRRLERVHIEGGLLPSPTLVSDLIKFLNQTNTVHGKKIVGILESMLELEKMARPIRPEEPMIAAMECKRTDPAKFKLHWEIEKHSALLQRELSKYRFRPRAEVAMGGGGQGPCVWAAWFKGNLRERPERQLRMRASEALEMIFKLTQLGDLTRLRRCRKCQKWLFARFRHQVFCSTECQQKNFTQTDEWKEHRRLYMRQRYRQLFSKSG